MPCPVVLRACDGLHGCELRHRRDLAHDARNHDEKAPYQGPGTTVGECEADVAVRRSAVAKVRVRGVPPT